MKYIYIRRKFSLLIAIGIAALSLAVPAAPFFAQQKAKKLEPASAQKAAKPPEPEVIVPKEAPPPPYEPEILKLAEIMGSLAFLGDLCAVNVKSPPSAIWRAKAQELLANEETTPARKEQFTGRFNRGFNSYREVYRTCTANAETSRIRLLQDGAKLTREISSRFAG